MKIIFYSPHPTHDIVSETGYSTHQREVINALRNLGHEVLPVVLGGTEKSNLNPLAEINYKPSSIKTWVKKLIPAVIWTTLNNIRLRRHDKNAGKRLEKAILEFSPELIYERSEYLQDSGTIMALKYKIRHFIEVNAPLVDEMRAFEGKSLLESKGHAIEKFKFEHADKVIVVSTALKEFIEKRYHCEPSKIFVQPNCINPDKIKTDSDRVASVRSDLGIIGKKVIGFVGSMFPYHGVDVLIEAFSELSKDREDLCLMVVGDGIVLNELKEMSQKLGLKDKVIFTGRIPHQAVFNYIELMDVCIMARSNWYGSPVKIFEYGLMRKPIIAPDTVPVRDVITDEEDALIVSDSSAELVRAISRLLNDSVRAHAMADHFHQKVMDEYNWAHAARNIIQLCA